MIQVKFFASLREQMGQAETTITAEGVHSVVDVWQKLNTQQALPDQLLIAINQEYANSDADVVDGDEVAFFPPVTGG